VIPAVTVEGARLPLRLGATDYLTKPVRRDVLVLRVRRALR